MFDYFLKEGIADTSNTIKLVDYYGLDPNIITLALEYVSIHNEDKEWKII